MEKPTKTGGLVLLFASKAAYYMGHGAVLIGSDDLGWLYISKDGTQENMGFSGHPTKNQAEFVEFKTLKDFAQSPQNNKDGEPYYTSAYFLSSSLSKLHRDQGGELSDNGIVETMLHAAIRQREDFYKLLGKSCIDVCSAALDAGGFDPGFIDFPEMMILLLTSFADFRYYEGRERKGWVNLTPLNRLEDILKNNPFERISDRILLSPEEKKGMKSQLGRVSSKKLI